jgi:hypothetical protein
MNKIFDIGSGFFVNSINELTKAGKKAYFSDKYNSAGWYKFRIIETIYRR